MSALHGDQLPTDGIHVIHAYEYANAGARTGASGFVVADIGKVARQLSDETFWVLVTTAPTWAQLSGGGGGGVEVKDEGASIGSKVKINFVGPGITASTDGIDTTQANVTLSTGTPVSVGTANAAGVADSLARSDHAHKSTYLQSVFTEISVNTTTTSLTFVTLLSQAITIQAGSVLKVLFTAGCSNTSNNQTAFFRVLVDGVVQRAVGSRLPTANQPGSAALTLRIAGLAAGSRTVTVEWRTTGGTLQVRPVAAPDAEHASLLLEEVTV